MPHAKLDRAGRFEELDVFRGLAALAVVLFHYTDRFALVYQHPSDPGWSVPLGHYGVQFFFMISGFVIFMTLSRCNSWKDFIVSRFSRLYPAYWFAIAVTFLVGSVWPLADQHYSIAQLAVNLTMLQGYFYVDSIDGVYWTLGWELSFYIMMLGIFLIKQLHNIEKLAVLWLALMTVNQHLANIGHDLPWRVSLLFVLYYTNLFMAGIMYYRIWQKGHSPLRYVILIASLGLQFWVDKPEGALLATVFFVLFWLAIHGYMRWINNPITLWLGAISYTLYLTHQMLGFRLMSWLYELGIETNLGIALTVLAACGLSSGITYFVERPAMRAVRNAYKKYLNKAL